MFGNGVEHHGHIKLRQQHDMRPEHHSLNHAQRHPVGMEHRQHRDEYLVPRTGSDDPRPALFTVHDEITMGQHRAFGRTGRSGGVQQDGDIGRRGLDRCAHRRGPAAPQHVEEGVRPGIRGQLRHNFGAFPARLGDRQPEQQLVLFGQKIRNRGGNDLPHFRPAGSASRRHRRVSTVETDHVLRSAVGELMGQLGLGVEGIRLGHNRAEPQHRLKSDHMLWAVRQDQRDAIAGPDAQLRKTLSKCADLLGERAIGQRGTKERNRWTFRKSGHNILEQLAQRDIRDLNVRGDTIDVG